MKTGYRSQESESRGVDELINAHWEYVASVMTQGMPGSKLGATDMAFLEFHYKSAFRHGYKHGVQDEKRRREQ